MHIQVPTTGMINLQLPKEFAGSILLVNVRPDGVSLQKALVIGDPFNAQSGEAHENGNQSQPQHG